MSTQKSKPELVRLAWITELRRQGHRQCVGPRGGKDQVCALVLLYETVADGNPCVRERALENGLSEEQVDAVIRMNDGRDWRTRRTCRRHTFAEIADVVEGWFPNG